MEVKKVESSDKDIRLEVNGEGHSFCNALQQFLLKDPAVIFSGYKIIHPLIGRPVFHIRTQGGKLPEQSAIDAAKALQNKLEEIKKTFEKIIES